MKKLFIIFAVSLFSVPAWSGVYVGNSDWTQPYTSDAYTRGLWHLDETTGTTAPVADASSYNNTGTLATGGINGWYPSVDPWQGFVLDPNKTWVSSKTGFGNCAKAWYNSSTDTNCGAISFANLAANSEPLIVPLNMDITVEFWMYPLVAGSSWGGGPRLVKCYTGGSFSTNFVGQNVVYHWNSGAWESLADTYTVPLNDWTHVAVTVDRTSSDSDIVTFWYNGTANASHTVIACGTGPYGYDNDLSLFTDGVWNSGALYRPRQFSGMLDEVRLSDTLRYIPEPTTLSLLAVGLLAITRRKK